MVQDYEVFLHSVIIDYFDSLPWQLFLTDRSNLYNPRYDYPKSLPNLPAPANIGADLNTL
ncbi:hypothetical protein F7734_03640 [Scytonema sp. UIC 10036]|uniref:hypothetical protein n=1 Tax=Scytonema sp. UIC 10036 TaxID=2304196 RepID=UPI0012DAD14E|nr:hypothetical protein [Scytonema sp. UIC 10036]MUG91624.1 hypothetical protein [Scytonema sp. UIC 10036]